MKNEKQEDQSEGIKKELNHSHHEWESVFQAIMHPVVILDPQHKVIAANRATIQLTGKPAGEIIGKKCYEIFHGKDTVAPPEGCPMEKLIKSGHLETFKMELETPGGFFLFSCTPVFDEQGNLERIIHIATDITERKQAEKALQESEEKYRDLFENAIDPIFMLDAEHNFVDMNKRAIDLFRYSREEFLQMKVFDIIPPEQVPVSKEEFEKLHTNGKYEKFIGKVRTKDGQWLDIEVSSSAIVKDGRIIGSRDIVRDITERKRSEEMLRERGELLERFFDATHISIVYLDKNSNFIRVNKAYADACGYPPEFFPGKNHFDLYPNDENEAIFRHVSVTGTPFTIYAKPFEYPDHPEWGVTYWDWTLYPVKSADGTVEGLLLVLLDVTRNKKAEDALRENEIRFRAVFENSVDAIGVSKDGDHVFMNPAYLSLFGYTSADELTGKPIIDLIAPEEHEKILENVRRRTKGIAVPSFYETRGLRKDGIEFDMDVHVSTYTLAGETYTLVILRDITERKRAEEALKESEECFRILLNQSFDGIFIHENFMILDLNQQMADILGYSRTELIQTSISDRITSDSQRLVKEYIGSGKGGYYEVELQRKDGRIVQIESFGAPCKFHGRDARIVAIRDITEQKKLQEQLRQAQKMEAVGHLAGGVAHDFNNILSAIVGYAHLTLMKMKDDDPLRMNLEQILASSERAANLTQSLLSFSRKQVMELKAVNLNDIIFGMKKILDRVIGEDIEFKVNATVHGLIIKADKGQIEQVLMNLAANARDAMPNGGILTITTEEVEIDERFIQMHQHGEAGRYAVITVTDTGVGMDDKTRENIFEPFFTTKEVGKGTGLGLAMVYGTIKQHEGFINVYSEHGKGTTFKIYLPLAESGVQLTEKKEATPVSSGNETILLVEDDEAVRRSTKALLEVFGYTVIEAIDGKHAVKLFRENKDLVQLVITDIIMPGQSGKDVYEALQKIKPDIKVLFISGYGADKLAKTGVLEKGINFIPKPLRPDAFSRKIREILDQ